MHKSFPDYMCKMAPGLGLIACSDGELIISTTVTSSWRLADICLSVIPQNWLQFFFLFCFFKETPKKIMLDCKNVPDLSYFPVSTFPAYLLIQGMGAISWPLKSRLVLDSLDKQNVPEVMLCQFWALATRGFACIGISAGSLPLEETQTSTLEDERPPGAKVSHPNGVHPRPQSIADPAIDYWHTSNCGGDHQNPGKLPIWDLSKLPDRTES